MLSTTIYIIYEVAREEGCCHFVMPVVIGGVKVLGGFAKAANESHASR